MSREDSMDMREVFLSKYMEKFKKGWFRMTQIGVW